MSSMVTTAVVYVRVKDLQQIKLFLRNFLDIAAEPSTPQGVPCLIVKQDENVQLLLTDTDYTAQTDTIPIYTNDCLELYCRLKAKGIIFNGTPSYHAEGLMAEFTDGHGNQYALLEARKYND